MCSSQLGFVVCMAHNVGSGNLGVMGASTPPDHPAADIFWAKYSSP